MRLEINGEFYRKRRGELVQIPPEWVDKVTQPQTIRKRQSKMTNKLKNSMAYNRPTSQKYEYARRPSIMPSKREQRHAMIDDDA